MTTMINGTEAKVVDLTHLLFRFKGRINRGAFWLGAFLAWVYYGLAFTTFELITGQRIDPLHPWASTGGSAMQHLIWQALLFTSVGVVVWIDLAVQIKRWHDRGKSGWWVLICASGVGVLWALVECGLMPGQSTPNRYDVDQGGVDQSVYPLPVSVETPAPRKRNANRKAAVRAVPRTAERLSDLN